MLEALLNRGSVPVLEQVSAFTEARHRVLVNNISNVDTVGYKMQDLPVAPFQEALRSAVERRDRQGASAALEMRSSGPYRWDSNGHLEAHPVEAEGENLLFHDGNNRFVEKQLSEMSKNGLLHNVVNELLRGKYEGLETAIRGRL